MRESSSTIIVAAVIVIASIVIFNGFSSMGRAKLADFAQQVNNVDDAVVNAFSRTYSDYGLKNEPRKIEQIYYEVATSLDAGTEGTMMGANVTTVGISDKKFQRINPDIAPETLRLVLPEVQGTNEAWYVTSTGRVFNATGYYDKDSNRTYFRGDCYYQGKLPESTDITNEKVAEAIAETILNGEVIVKF